MSCCSLQSPAGYSPAPTGLECHIFALAFSSHPGSRRFCSLFAERLGLVASVLKGTLPWAGASPRALRGWTINGPITPCRLLEEALGFWEGGIFLAEGSEPKLCRRDLGLQNFGLKCKPQVISKLYWQEIRESRADAREAFHFL